MDQTKWYTINYPKILESEKASHLDQDDSHSILLDGTECPIQGGNVSGAIPEITTENTK